MQIAEKLKLYGEIIYNPNFSRIISLKPYDANSLKKLENDFNKKKPETVEKLEANYKSYTYDTIDNFF